MNRGWIGGLLCLAGLSAGCSERRPVHERAWVGGCYERISLPEGVCGKSRSGVLVARVFEGTPAATAGLREGDVILRVDGRDVSGPAEFYQELDAGAPGTPLKVEWFRFGETGQTSFLRGREKYERWRMFGLGLYLSPHLDLWPNPDFDVFGVLRLETRPDRPERADPRERLGEYLRRERRDGEGFRLALFPVVVGKRLKVLSQEVVTSPSPSSTALGTPP